MGLGFWLYSGRARTAARRGASSGSHGSALLAHARAGGGRRGTGRRELEEDKAHGLCLGRIRPRTAGMGGTGRWRGDAWLGTDVETANDVSGGRQGTRRT